MEGTSRRGRNHGSPGPGGSYDSSDPDSTDGSGQTGSDGSGRAGSDGSGTDESYDSSVRRGTDISSEERSYVSGDGESVSKIMDQAPQKRPKTCPPTPDRISALPDSVLLYVLSFLPIEDAIKSGILSKRWAYLWTSVPTLTFQYVGVSNQAIRRFISFVDRTLILYGRSDIKRFHINFNYLTCFNSHVNVWIRFATIHNVEELDLLFYLAQHEYHSEAEHYVLPQYLYTNASLRKLNLQFCRIVPNGIINWRSLKVLSISYAKLSDDLIQKILLGSPVLESLELYRCYGFNRMDITSVSLKKLVINDYWECSNSGDDLVMEISAPNLRSLGILGHFYRKKCRLMNLSSLVDANLSFQLFVADEVNHIDSKEYRNVVRELLEKLHHVKELTIGSWCMQTLSICEVRGLPSPSSKCKCLILDTCNDKWDLPGIASLLQSSSDLETLVINITNSESVFDRDFFKPYNFDEKKFWTSPKRIFKCLLWHLRTVKIVGFTAGCGEIELVFALIEFLLKNARVLEKMVIYTRSGDQNRCWKNCGPEKILEVAQRLLSFPRSSPHAEIILS